MKEPISLAILTFCFNLVFGQTMTPHWKAVNSNKMKYYYWDSHKNIPENIPPNIDKEYIYHFSSTDSILEREITYDIYNRPVQVKKYSVPSKGELIETDSLYYNSDGLLEAEKYFKQGYYGKIDTVIVKYSYDNEKREISKVTSENFGPNKWITSYETGSTGNKIERKFELWNTPDKTEEIHFFGNSGRKDSIQIYINGKWFQTTEFKYDTLNRTKDTYFRYSNYRALRAKIIFNAQGFVTYVLTNEIPNWNQTKIYNVEVNHYYSADNYTKVCEIIIGGKIKYLKKHYYTYRINSP